MNETVVTMCGTVGVEPRFIQSHEGVAITTLRIASNSRRYDRTQKAWIDSDTIWMTVTCFRALAMNVLESVHKGERVIVQGRLRIRNWERGERRGTSTEIVADAVGHDLAWGRCDFTKVSRSERVEPGRAEADELATAMELAGELGEQPDAEPDGPEHTAAGLAHRNGTATAVAS